MNVLVDTSVLTAAAVRGHVQKPAAQAWLRDARRRDKVFASTHGLAELYATLTSSAFKPRIYPPEARKLIARATRGIELLELTTADYMAVLRQAVKLHMTSGLIYDALHARAASKRRIRYICTFNVRHFVRFWPADRIIVP